MRIPILLLFSLLLSSSLLAEERDRSLLKEGNNTFATAEISKISSSEKLSMEKIANIVENLEISGYFQAQWQQAQSMGQLGYADGKEFPLYSDNIFQVRRTRIKFQYTYGIVRGVFQFDATEKKLRIQDSYIEVKSKNGMYAARAGCFNIPFGYELAYSSSKRETPERSRMYNLLFPDMRDIGAKVTIEGEKNTLSNKFNLNVAVINGNSFLQESDSRKNVSAHLGFSDKNDKIEYGLGASIYRGGVLSLQNSRYVYNEATRGYDEVLGSNNIYTPRNYYGFDARISLKSRIGTTTLRAEYIGGTQQGTAMYNDSPTEQVILPLYERDFSAFAIYAIQSIGKSNFSVAFRLDQYDPNRHINGSDIGIEGSNTDRGDLTYTTLASGVVYDINKHCRLMVSYDKVWNEKAAQELSYTQEEVYRNCYDFTQDLKDNILTIRAQIKF